MSPFPHSLAPRLFFTPESRKAGSLGTRCCGAFFSSLYAALLDLACRGSLRKFQALFRPAHPAPLPFCARDSVLDAAGCSGDNVRLPFADETRISWLSSELLELYRE
jgi:hypothetical protein